MADMYNRERKILSCKKKFKEDCPSCLVIVESLIEELSKSGIDVERIIYDKIKELKSGEKIKSI